MKLKSVSSIADSSKVFSLPDPFLIYIFSTQKVSYKDAGTSAYSGGSTETAYQLELVNIYTAELIFP